MGDKSKIEWTDATWNPVTGCTKVSQGCKHCYAERLFPRVYGPRIKDPSTWGPNGSGRQFSDVRCHPERLDQPLHWRRPRRVFVNSMSDLFHEDVPDQFIKEVWATMANARQHTFQVLTKRPERMRDLLTDPTWKLWLGIPNGNAWLGVSIEDQPTADERIPLLLQTPAAVRFVSYEPALGPVDFLDYLPDTHDGHPDSRGEPWLDWVIAGGESGPKARPAHPDWFRSVRDQCQAAGVAFLFKQWGEWAPWIPMPSPREPRCHVFDDGARVWRWGKKASGRELDGRTWDEFHIQRSEVQHGAIPKAAGQVR